jgi:hypothetical protein
MKVATITVSRERLAEAAARLLRGDSNGAYEILVFRSKKIKDPLTRDHTVKE